MKNDTNIKERSGRSASPNETPSSAAEDADIIMPEETELETMSSLTRPPASTRHVNQSTRSSKGQQRPPLVEEIPPNPPDSVEQRSAASARKEEIILPRPPEEEDEETSKHAVGAYRIRGTDRSSTHTESREVSRASSSQIIVPNALVVDESDTITAYMVDPADPADILFGDSSEKKGIDEEICSCIWACQVSAKDFKKNHKHLTWITAAIIVVVVIATVATLLTKSEPSPREKLQGLIRKTSPDGGISLRDQASYQSAAFSWLAKDPDLSTFNESQKIERYALACFYYSLGGENWTSNGGWMTHGGSSCDWFNVTCGHGGTVTAIRLIQNNLRGNVLVPELAMLQSMKTLELVKNTIESTIPENIGHMPSLVQLILRNDSLEGSIPSSVSKLSNLQELDLDSNCIESTIPADVGNMASLSEMILRNNSLHGTIPSSLSKLSNLQYLKLHRNGLIERIPKELSELKNLIHLNLGDNALTGPIPSKLSAMKTLQVLKLFHNNLTSTIPTELGEMTSIVQIDLNINRLVSTIPSELANLKNLKRLKLFGNMLNGTVPEPLCNITRKIAVDCVVNCSCCEPECRICESYASCKKLTA